MAGLKPDPFQMLLFMWSADVVIADAPGASIGLGWWANLILGKSLVLPALCAQTNAFLILYCAGKLVGENLLGYSEKYKVFDD